MRRAHWLLVAVTLLVAAYACRPGTPVVDPGPKPPSMDGTISGTVRGPAGTSSIVGRQVEVIDVDTNERQRALTSNTGGFTFKVKPGKYRVEVTLVPGESILKQPGIMDVNKSDVDAHADFVIGTTKVSRPRSPTNGDSALGAPIA
jgi:Carboxypeptidase regulatory-like domain